MAQKLYIPHIGCLLRLTEDWTFNLEFEHRNNGLIAAFHKDPAKVKSRWWWYNQDLDEDLLTTEVKYHKAMTPEELEDSYSTFRSTNSRPVPYIEVTLPAETTLKVDRIYIRNGLQAYNSVTFRTLKTCPEKRFASKRFWVKLHDANNIVATILG